MAMSRGNYKAYILGIDCYSACVPEGLQIPFTVHLSPLDPPWTHLQCRG